MTVLAGSGRIDPNTNAAAAGLFTITGAAGANVTITYTPSIQLVSRQLSRLMFEPRLVGAPNVTLQQVAEPLPSGTTLTLGQSGRYSFWLGGSVVLPPGQAPGIYTGVIAITVSY